MTSPILSILVPTFNVALYLNNFWSALINQVIDWTKVEIIFVDDCSTDGTINILQELSCSYPIEAIYIDENIGIGSIRNTLLNKATGRYIWFLDSDDFINPGALEYVLEVIFRLEPDIIISDYISLVDTDEFGGNRKVQWRRGHSGMWGILNRGSDIVLENSLYVDKMYVWNKIFKREVIVSNAIIFQGYRSFEDMPFVIEFLLHAKRSIYSARRLVTYRQRPGSITKTLTRRKVADWESAIARIENLILANVRVSNDLRLSLHYCVIKNYMDIIDYAARHETSFEQDDIERYCKLCNKQVLVNLSKRLLMRAKLKELGMIWKQSRKSGVNYLLNKCSRPSHN